MKILRHGEFKRFLCDACGCEFIAGKNEYTDCGFVFTATCPDCDCRANSAKTRIKDKESEEHKV